jgi:hypothetical protein
LAHAKAQSRKEEIEIRFGFAGDGLNFICVNLIEICG